MGRCRARVVVSGMGPLAEPKIPPLEGLDSFEGETFHSARWNHDYDLTGKRVAAVGTGASAIQFVPEIQKDVAQLHVIQRTAAVGHAASEPADHARSRRGSTSASRRCRSSCAGPPTASASCWCSAS